jgi:hypothetical protein
LLVIHGSRQDALYRWITTTSDPRDGSRLVVIPGKQVRYVRLYKAIPRRYIAVVRFTIVINLSLYWKPPWPIVKKRNALRHHDKYDDDDRYDTLLLSYPARTTSIHHRLSRLHIFGRLYLGRNNKLLLLSRLLKKYT